MESIKTNEAGESSFVCICGLFAVGRCVDCGTPACASHLFARDERWRCATHHRVAGSSSVSRDLPQDLAESHPRVTDVAPLNVQRCAGARSRMLKHFDGFAAECAQAGAQYRILCGPGRRVPEGWWCQAHLEALEPLVGAWWEWPSEDKVRWATTARVDDEWIDPDETWENDEDSALIVDEDEASNVKVRVLTIADELDAVGPCQSCGADFAAPPVLYVEVSGLWTGDDGHDEVMCRWCLDGFHADGADVTELEDN